MLDFVVYVVCVVLSRSSGLVAGSESSSGSCGRFSRNWSGEGTEETMKRLLHTSPIASKKVQCLSKIILG